MKIIYMGTPDFAVPALKALANSEHEVCAVFTQPDKPRGRKMIMTPPDVKVCAEKLNIPVYQPETFKDGKPLVIINKYNPDVIVVAAYADREQEFTVDVNDPKVKSWQGYRTSDVAGEDLLPVGKLKNKKVAVIPARSVTTFVSGN